MKVLTGIDIIEIKRVEDSIKQFGSSFLDKIYTNKEIEYCESRKMSKYQHYAARFAAKEAIYKAISTFSNNEGSRIDWKDMEVINLEDGKPVVKLKNIDFKDKIECIDISISHCKEYATASAVVLCK